MMGLSLAIPGIGFGVMIGDLALDGKVVLITGGTSGIGRATALAFAKRGARVVVSGRSADRGRDVVEEIRALGTEAELVEAELSSPAAVRSLVRAAVDRFGRLDCAFNNAAEVGTPGPLVEGDEDEFDRIVAVDLKSVWLGMQLEIKQMLEQDEPGGAIVNTSSVNGLGGVPDASLYAMAKAGVIALTKSAALEVAARGIRINAVIPGAVRTPMLDGVIGRMSGDDPAARQEVERTLDSMIPVGRAGRPEEIAEAVVWLCSDAASYVTGHSMIIDGGVTAPYR